MWFPTRRTVATGGLAVALVAAFLAGAVWGVSRHIDAAANPHLFDDLRNLPHRDVGLVLGTSRNRSGGLNEFYSTRIAAAAELYHSGKIGHIIVSGSNPSRYYNEPAVMKRDLVEMSVPPESITEDDAGLRTLDSVVRANKVMGQHSFVVVSQRFHAARAVYLAREFGLDVIGYCANDPPGPALVSAQLREYGARFKAMLDVTVLGTQPMHLGEPVAIELQSTKSEIPPPANPPRSDPGD